MALFLAAVCALLPWVDSLLKVILAAVCYGAAMGGILASAQCNHVRAFFQAVPGH